MESVVVVLLAVASKIDVEEEVMIFGNDFAKAGAVGKQDGRLKQW